MMKNIVRIILISLFLPVSGTIAQSIPTTLHPVEEAYRRAQLDGRLDSSVSFTIRPLVPALAFKADSLNNELSQWTNFSHIANETGRFSAGILPLTWKQQYNSTTPYGWNDGAMIQARGYQTLVSAGFFAKAGILTVQLQPEFVFAENSDFEKFWAYNLFDEVIDRPERLGSGSYSKVNWGQSSIRLNMGPVSLGLSNENLWWGPGVRNSILMGNSAAGFKHITFNTTRPLRTPVGSFEMQLLGGRLEESGYASRTLPPKRNEWRYLSAAAISYQPKWVPGLFFGLTRSFQAYHSDLKKFGDYIPLFTPYQKVKTVSGDPFDRDQLTSVYSRWLFQKAKAELYFEYGVNDNAFNMRDFIMSPEHARAYTFGFSKLVPLRPASGEQIHVRAEVTQMSQSIDRILRNADAFYLHGTILHGYTHQGEVLGAGIGPGGNLQSLNLSWVRNFKSFGFQAERYVHNEDLYSLAFQDINGHSRQWVDLAFSATATWDYKNILFDAKLQGIQSLNYQWRMQNYSPDVYYIPENDIFNMHAELGLTYRF